MSYAIEKQVAVAAVRRACALTASVFNKLVKSETLTKGDKSPVTGCVARPWSIRYALNSPQLPTTLPRLWSIPFSLGRFPLILSSEKKTPLIFARRVQTFSETESSTSPTRRSLPISQLVTGPNGVSVPGSSEPSTSCSMPSIGETTREVLSDVRRPCSYYHQRRTDPIDFAGRWTLDPIDGTKGFLRGGQYAICLALIEDGDVKLGVIGCPNLPVHGAQPEEGLIKGCILAAVKGQGAEQVG